MNSRSQSGWSSRLHFRKPIWVLAALGGLFVLLTILWRFEQAATHRSPLTSPKRGSRSASPQHVAQRASTHAEPPNSRPNVEYVGDASCARCHIAESSHFRNHPMGRSLAAVNASAESADLASAAEFSNRGWQYGVSVEDGRVIHTESKLDDSGATLVKQSQEVHIAIGSGTQGRSYVINRDGRLFFSPITWYPRLKKFDLSPGFEKANAHFNRAIVPVCLFCHANYVEVDESSINSYRGDLSHLAAIGCERCHGPGALHVARHDQATSHSGVDDSIVNPRRLPPALRDAVCEQCHLSGVLRVARRGHDTFDYRPGLPLDQFWSIFVKSAPKSGQNDFVGHVEQMHASRCFRASNAELGCISCHDPHQKPSAAEAEKFYRDRCLKCHADRGCSLPAPERALKNDHCVACHMPRLSTEVRHTANTDHRIPRVATATGPTASAARDESDDGPLVQFHRKAWPQDSVVSSDELARDLGIALMMCLDVAPELSDKIDLRQALDFLRRAANRDPQDFAAVESWAVAQYLNGNAAGGLQTLTRLVEQAPEREFALDAAAKLAQDAGRHQDAVRFWERAIQRNPWSGRYHLSAAVSYANLGQWPACVISARKAVEFDPANPAARQILVEGLLGQREFTEAEPQFLLLNRLDPKNAAQRREWFDQHPLRKP